MKHRPAMAIERKGSLATRFVAAVLAGTLALGFTPVSQAVAADDLQVAGGSFAVQEESSGSSYTDSVNGVTYGYKDFAVTESTYPQGSWTSSSNGKYVYKSYAQGDNAHYGTYSLNTELTVKDGVLTGINLTSGVDTFFGKWGMYTPHTDNWTVQGYLPKGVEFTTTSSTGNDGSTSITPQLKLPDNMSGVPAILTSVYLESAKTTDDATALDAAFAQKSSSGGYNKGGNSGKSVTSAADATTQGEWTADYAITTYTTDRATKQGSYVAKTETEYAKVEVNSSDNNKVTVTLPDKVKKATIDTSSKALTWDESATEANPANLLRFVYKIGDYATFSCYAKVGATAGTQSQAADAASAYLNQLKKTDYSEDVTVSGMGSTNRDRWTKTMLSETAQRWIPSWSKGLADPGLTKQGDPATEVYTIDAISGATKTSLPYKEALEKAYDAKYFTSVADDLKLTVDGGDSSGGYEITRDTYTDKSSAVSNASGQYVVTLAFMESGDDGDDDEEEQQKSSSHGGGSSMSVNNIKLFALGDQKIGSQGIMFLQEAATKAEDTGVETIGGYTPVHAVTSGLDKDVSDEYMKWDAENRVLTILNSSVTHIAVEYQFAHAPSRHAYSLADLTAATAINTRAAKGGTPSSAELLGIADSWNAMNTEAHGFVGTQGFALVKKALQAQADAKSSSQKPAATTTPSKTTPAATTTTETTTTPETTTPAATDTETGLATGETATTGTGAKAAVMKVTSDSAVEYEAPATKSTKKVTVPDTVTINNKTYKVTAIKANAFKGSKATSITVGNNVTTIKAKTFNGATKLKSVTLGKGVKKLSKNAFKGAKKLTKVTIKSKKLTTKKAVKGAFKGSKVKTVVLKGMTAKQKKAVKKAIEKWGGKSGITVK